MQNDWRLFGVNADVPLRRDKSWFRPSRPWSHPPQQARSRPAQSTTNGQCSTLASPLTALVNTRR
jgi:hypothetical protein